MKKMVLSLLVDNTRALSGRDHPGYGEDLMN